MSLSLLELTQNYFLGSTGHQTSTALGESEPTIRQGLQSAVPLVIGALLVRAQRPGGAAELASQAQQVYDHGLLGDLRKLLASLPPRPTLPQGPPAARSADLLHTLLGSDYPSAVAGISQQAGLRPDTVGDLLRVAVAVVLGLLGRHAAQQNLSPAELANYLASQRDTVWHAVSGLPSSISGTFPDLLSGPTRVTAKTVMQASYPVDGLAGPVGPAAAPASAPPVGSAELTPPLASMDPVENTSQVASIPRQKEVPIVTPAAVQTPFDSHAALPPRVRPAAQPTARPARRWPWLLGVLALALLGYLGWKGFTPPSRVPAPTTAVPAATGPTTRVSALATGHYEVASDTYRYDPGATLLVQLPGGNQLRVGENTAEAQLFYLLTGSPKARPDHAQAGIRLDQVDFAVGSATLTAASQAQLAHLAALLRAFPEARLKIGGFTDNQGPAETSLLRSTDRANAVRNALTTQQVAPDRIAAQGYGQTHPLTSNDTREGRAQNRRVAILLTKK